MSSNEFKIPYYNPRRPAPRPNRPGEAPQPWTTARCSRLLRPLLSRITSLRKDAAASLLHAKDHNPERDVKVTEQHSTDQEWLGPRKRVRLTYSQKRTCSRQDGQSTLGRDPKGRSTVKCLRQSEGRPGEIVPATPLLRRARGHVIPSPKIPSSRGEEPDRHMIGCKRGPRLKKDSTRNKDLDQRLAKMRAQSASSRHSDLEAIYRSLEALLKATRHDAAPKKGPRSFLDMCLRKVPQYIEELEAWERMEAEQNGTVSTLDVDDTSAYIYNYLESIGPNPALGWKHLRVVVRADGLDAVKQAISEGLFGDDFTELLIDLCVQADALSEAEELIAMLTDRQYPQPTTPDSSFSELASLRPLSVLWTFANKHDRNSFLLRQYSVLLSNGNLPQDWLATREFECIWSLAARGLSVAEAADDAVAFIRQSISLLCQRKRANTGVKDATRQEKEISTANKQTLISALTMLAAMSSLGEIELQSGRVSEAEAGKISLIGGRLRYILGACMAELAASPMRRTPVGDLLHLALFLSSRTARGDDAVASRLRSGIEQTWRANVNPSRTRRQQHHHRLDDVASFASSVARSCGRGMAVASRSCLDVLFGQLAGLGLEREILDGMKAVAAFSLAQQTNDVKDFIYAERLQRAAAWDEDDDEDNAARSRSLFTGYRWEETIGEWVTVSPVVERRQQPRTRVRQSGSSSRIESDHSEDIAEELAPRVRGSIYGDADSVPDLEIAPTRQGEDYKAQGSPAALGAERVNLKPRKRALSCPKDERPRAAVGVAAPYRNKQLTKSAHLSLDDELSSDKENQNHATTKKPRRSIDRRTILGPKSRSSLASQASTSMLMDDCSDDELCM
ncbi:hypothetical protein F4804DRAFT_299268 [Jackrogersella minutella]|nr:hypothetical protein F4804DRAFT_299268 [Jackrogersella minutella]